MGSVKGWDYLRFLTEGEDGTMGWEGRGPEGAMGHRCMRVRAEMGVGEGGNKMLKRMSGEVGVDVGWKMLTQDLVER